MPMQWDRISVRRAFFWGRIFTIAALVLALSAVAARAAQKLKAGDPVEVRFLGQWRPGTVIATNARGDVLAEYQFAGASQRRAFKRADVRRPHEAGALTPTRTWTDASGKFRVEAVLLSVEGKNAKLRKPDMSELTVPIAKLAELDQRYIERMTKRAETPGNAAGRPSAPKLPPLEEFGGGGAFGASAMSPAGGRRAALTPDPLPSYLKLKQGGVAFPVAFFGKIGAILPVGGGDGWVLTAVPDGTPGGALPTRLLWISLERQKVESELLLPPGELVLDYHPPSHRLLTASKVEDGALTTARKAALTVWEVLPTDKRVEPVVRWRIEADRGGLQDLWARILDKRYVAQRGSNHEIIVWDTVSKRLHYRTPQESFFAPAPVLGGGRKYLILPEDEQVRILEAATGKLLSSLPVTSAASGVAVSEKGDRLAVLERNVLRVWNLTDASAEPKEYEAAAISSLHASLSWLGEDRLVVESTRGALVLYSLKHELALWSYSFDTDATFAAWGNRLHSVVAGHLVYGANVSNAGRSKVMAVGAVAMPGPKVDETAAALNRESLLILKPGDAVRLEVNAGEHSEGVRKALEKKIAGNGWKLDSKASAVVVAEMSRGESQQVTYEINAGQSRAPQRHTATVVPYISSLRIQIGDVVAWQTGTRSGAPPLIRLGEGQTAQSEVDKWQRPHPGFFDRVEMPNEILDPAKRNGLGATKVTNRGLISQ